MTYDYEIVYRVIQRCFFGTLKLFRSAIQYDIFVKVDISKINIYERHTCNKSNT